MDVDSFIEAVTPLLKAHGFKKSRFTWRKDQGESIAVFNVQKSAWGGGIYYVNIGAFFLEFEDQASPTEYQCHVRRRLEISEPKAVVERAIEWFSDRATVAAASSLAEADSNKGLVFHALRNARSA